MVKVSILMAVGPDAPFKDEAMASLEGQTMKDFEVLEQREKGIHNAWNSGAGRASGEYLAILDTDDIAMPDRLERQVVTMDGAPDLAVLGSWAQNFGARENVVKRPPRVTWRSLIVRNQLLNSSVMIRKSLAMPWRDEPWIDYPLWCRMAKKGLKMWNIQKALVKRRIHFDSDTFARSWVKVVHGELEARLQLF